MNYKKILNLSLLCAMMLLNGSCAKDYADEMATSDKNVAALKQTDIELRKLIQTGLATLNTQINAALSKTETEKRTAIKAKVEQWNTHMNEMIARMKTLTDKKIKEQTQRLNAQVTAIEGKIAAFEQNNKKQIEKLEADIRKAKEQGDAATLAKLQELKKRMKDADANMDAFNLKVDTWQGKLNSIASKNYSATYTELQARIQALEDIDMEKRYRNMQAMLKAPTPLCVTFVGRRSTIVGVRFVRSIRCFSKPTALRMMNGMRLRIERRGWQSAGKWRVHAAGGTWRAADGVRHPFGVPRLRWFRLQGVALPLHRLPVVLTPLRGSADPTRG